MDPKTARYEALLAEIASEFPRFRIVRKDRSPLQRAIGVALKILTFGGQSSYLDGYRTTIGQRVYVPADWDECDPDERYVTMRHELVHLRQFRRYTLVGMAVLYLLVPFPVGLAWFRARFEMEGYAETIRATAELEGIEAVRAPRFKEYVVSQFVTGAYGWMWPFRRRVERWYDGVVALVEAELALAAGAPRRQDELP